MTDPATRDAAGPALVTDQARACAAERPTDVAVVEVRRGGDDRSVTWDELQQAVDRTALLLRRLGVGPGESVCYQLPNWAEFVVISLATLRVGGVCCPIMPFFREREVSFVLQRSGARVLFVPGRFRERDYPAMLASMQGRLGVLEHVVVVRGEGESGPHPGPAGSAAPLRWHRFERALEEGAGAPAEPLGDGPTPDATAQLLFTSGTSGEPKGVLHRHATLDLAVAMHIRHFGLTRQDPIFIPSPLAHQTGFLYGMWLALRLGAPQVLQDVWDGRTGLRALRDWGVTFVQAATPFLADLVGAVTAGEAPPQALRCFVATGAAVPRALALEASSALGAAVCGGWGSTESCMGTAGTPDDPPEKAWGTDGRPLEGIQVRITDGAGHVLPAGSEGEFELRTPLLFEGYLGHPEWTAAACTPDGWYRSGDLAVLDPDGYVRLTGRVKDVINRGGEKIPVAEIEQLLYEHPAIQEVAIVAMPDRRLGERACAYVVLRPGGRLDFAALQHHLDDRAVARQYWPERLEIVAALPRTPSGKIQRYQLRERAARLAPAVRPASGSGDSDLPPSSTERSA